MLYPPVAIKVFIETEQDRVSAVEVGDPHRKNWSLQHATHLFGDKKKLKAFRVLSGFCYFSIETGKDKE